MLNNWNWNRMSRHNEQLADYNATMFGKFRDYSHFYSSELGIAFQFTSKPHNPGVEPYKDCRMAQAKKFARKRQIVLPNREKFFIKPKFLNDETYPPSANDQSTNDLKLLLVITYATHYSHRDALRQWTRNISKSSTTLDIEIEVLFIISHLMLDEEMTELKKESNIFNDILVPSLTDYPVISTLAYLTSG